MKKAWLTALTLVLFGGAAGAAHARTATDTSAYGISDNGKVTGAYQIATGTDAFIESGGVYTTIDVPGSISTIGLGVNDSGTVVGYASTQSGSEHSFIYSNGGFKILSDPLAISNGTFAESISNSGVVSGYYYATTGFHGFTYDSGVFTTVDDPAGIHGTILSGLNENGDETGVYFNGAYQRTAYVDVGGVFTNIADPAAPTLTFPAAINDSDEVVGTVDDSVGAEGFTEIGGVYTHIDDPSAAPGETWAYGLNDSGAIVGYYAEKTIGADGIGVGGFVDVGGHFTAIDDPEAYPFPVLPEPASWALMMTGVGFTGGALRARRGKGALAVRQGA
jgi:probable HAF family extracellular repeat protein